MNITVYTEGTGVIPDHEIAKLVEAHFDLRPKGIIQMLDLLRPIYSKTPPTATSAAKNPSSLGRRPIKQLRCAQQPGWPAALTARYRWAKFYRASDVNVDQSTDKASGAARCRAFLCSQAHGLAASNKTRGLRPLF